MSRQELEITTIPTSEIGHKVNGHNLNGNGHLSLNGTVIEAKPVEKTIKDIRSEGIKLKTRIQSTNGMNGNRDGLNKLSAIAGHERSGDCLNLGNIDSETLEALPKDLRRQILRGDRSLIIDCAGQSWMIPRQRMSWKNQMRSGIPQGETLSVKMVVNK